MIAGAIGGFSVLKLLVATGCAGGALALYTSSMTSVTRKKLRELFRTGDIAYKRKHKETKREIVRYPQVSRISVYHDCTHAVFVLPDGLNPKEIRDRRWLFEQTFGENIELTGSAKTFTLHIYHTAIEKFAYDVGGAKKAIAASKARLPIYVGKSRSGDEIYDMVEHPHLLIAGETGSGKSVALRSILTTLILNVAPATLDLYCADLKMSEFHVFKGIAKEVVVETGEVARVVTVIRREMKKRGALLNRFEVAHLDDIPPKERPPYIVLAIDEVALLKKEAAIMGGIEEISAIGRALGVFLILAMQRPDADVLDGKLKNNLTVRMAFKHSNEINSRITIDSGEAAHIKESDSGRMYLRLNGLREARGPFLDMPDAKRLLAPHKREEDVEPPTTPPEDDETIEIGVL